MKKKTIIAVVMSVCMLFAFAACGSGNDDSAATTAAEGEEAEATEETVDEEYLEQPDMSVFLAIDFAESTDKEDVADTMIEMSKDQTAADALQLFAEAEGMEIDIDVNGNVKSIDGAEGNWHCEINGEKASDGGMTVPSDGDDVYWIMK
ncbi:MAG: hypothetical protein IJJ01_06135 [Firmicutes bacterium]|nr:hypothetical protein [Bacillota bacterium]